MFFRRIVIVYITLFTLVFLSVIGTFIVVDPIGMWEVISIRGFNHYKIKQTNFIDVFKPYQYVKVNPDVVYIGSSRVYVGLPPDYPSSGGKKIYNMGCSSLSLKDTKEYLRFMYKMHKPEKVYLGLDFFQFSKENHNSQRTGFDNKRLNEVSGNSLECILFKIQETIALHEYIKPTISASKNHAGQEPLFDLGWDVERGNSSAPNPEEYYYTVNSLLKYYSQWEYEPKTVEELQAIIKDAADVGVELNIFFNIDTVDVFAILDSAGKLDEYFKMKKMVAGIQGAYDFSLYNNVTQDRSLFYDASHYRGILGEKILAAMVNRNVPNFGVKLNSSNVDKNLEDQKVLYLQWKSVGINSKYVDLLKNHIGQQPIQNEELEKYINLRDLKI